ncbi:Adrenocortical dysplasia protein-like protein [Camelus dromedarius]|uniref:Adrenocortical dysplasia protein-like protein n=1 Tax=Camelus dromedarius TaxID=9838 RepID=A0A5N4DUI1_CAMDR|nr:Adrenocortical dysplasia protein-like protein [Camelus dromedarius]
MHAHGRGLDLGSHPAILRFLFRREAGPRRQRETSASGPLLCTALGMAGVGSLVLRPWIRELVLGSEALSSPRAGQLLKVLQEAEAPGPSSAAGKSDVGASLLVSDGTHSIRCLVTREALNASDWEEKEFGFRGAEGRLLLLQDCEVRVQVAEGGAPAEFYLQVDRFSLLPTEQPREQVTGCNQDPDVREKLYDCLEQHLSESISPSAGLSLSQLLDEGEAVYTVPSLWLHISENDQQILSSLGPGQRPQGKEDRRGPELPPPHPALQDLSLTLISSPPSSPTSSGTPALPSHMLSEESGASSSLLPALSLAAPDPVQKGSSQPLPAICSAPGPLPTSSPQPSCVLKSPLLSYTPSLSPTGHLLSPHQAHVTRAQKPSLEFKELGLTPETWQHSPRTRATKGALESSPVWTPYPLQDPPKRHRDGSAFQYEYEPPCPSVCAQIQAARLPPQLVAWALHFLMEPQLDSELTQV